MRSSWYKLWLYRRIDFEWIWRSNTFLVLVYVNLFCQTTTPHSEKLKTSVMDKTTVYLEDEYRYEVIFEGETLTFTYH